MTTTAGKSGVDQGHASRTWRVRIAIAACTAVLAISGCASKRDALVAPQEMISPYDSSRGQVLWAVAPLRNESGTSAVDALAVTDKVVAAAAQARGVQVLPLNRTLEAMRALDLQEIRSLSDIQRLAAGMNVDAIVAGTITAWDPYTPAIGLTLALHVREGRLQSQLPQRLDPVALQMGPTDRYTISGRMELEEEGPASVAAQHLDGKNQGVQMRVQAYARGRNEPGSATGWRRFLASMELFSEFGAYDTVSALMDREWQRVSRVEARRK